MGPTGPAGDRIGHMYRWNVFNTSDYITGWLFGNNPDLFGGVPPSNWTDGCATAGQIVASKTAQRALFTLKGYPGREAVVHARTRAHFSSSDGEMVVVLFRVRNTTPGPITWEPHFWHSSYGSWNECASIALNGVNAFTSILNTGGALAAPTLSIPANRTTTVIFVAAAGPPFQTGLNNVTYRAVVAGFIDDSLALPAGLEFVDNLDTATGGYDQ